MASDTTPEPIAPDTFVRTLWRELASASELGYRGLHVQVSVPAESAYAYTDAQGERHAVHLPTRLKFAPMRFPGEPKEDGGPAAVFGIEANGYVPSESVVAAMSGQLYQASVRWGRVHHVRPDSPVPDLLPELPEQFEAIVESAIFTDVS